MDTPPPKFGAQETQSTVSQEQDAQTLCCFCQKALRPVECFKLIPMGDEVACKDCTMQYRKDYQQTSFSGSSTDSTDDDSSSDDEDEGQEACDYCKGLYNKFDLSDHEKNGIIVLPSIAQYTLVRLCDACYDNRNNFKGAARRLKGFFKRGPQS